jgi:hypothetical protein
VSNRLNKLATKLAIYNDLMPDLRKILGTSDLPDLRKNPVRIGREPMNLTEEENAKLGSLSGKEKKAYVKELRAKYDIC